MSHPELAAVRGPVLFPGDAGYAEEVAVFNTAVAHHPYVVVGATGATDVQTTVRFARDQGRSVAVLNTGHNPYADVDGDAVMITTRRMAGVNVDKDRRTARVEAGVTWGQVVEEAAKVGLAPLAGSSPQVGVVGYTLGGGVSISLGRAFGYAADHVRAIEVVTADGEFRQVAQDSDLFEALLGGKGNLGVVTAIEFSLFPVTELYAGFIQFAGDHARDVLAAYRTLTQAAPDELTSSIVFLRAPDLPFIPEFMRGRLTVLVRLSYLGTETEGAKLIAPLRAAASPLVDTVATMPVGQIASISNDPTDPSTGIEHFATLDELSQSTMDAITEATGNDESPTLVTLTQLGGAFDNPSPNAVRRDVAFTLLALTVVPPGGELKPQDDRGRALANPITTGRKHPGYLSPADAPGVRQAYDEATYARLKAAKDTWDPRNMFRWSYPIP